MEDTVSAALARYEKDGFTASFRSLPGGRLQCLACRQETVASRVQLMALHRLEGTSDPSDELALAALICPACGRKGTAVLGYGPEAAPEDGVVLAALRDHRGEDGRHPGL